MKIFIHPFLLLFFFSLQLNAFDNKPIVGEGETTITYPSDNSTLSPSASQYIQYVFTNQNNFFPLNGLTVDIEIFDESGNLVWEFYDALSPSSVAPGGSQEYMSGPLDFLLFYPGDCYTVEVYIYSPDDIDLSNNVDIITFKVEEEVCNADIELVSLENPFGSCLPLADNNSMFIDVENRSDACDTEELKATMTITNDNNIEVSTDVFDLAEVPKNSTGQSALALPSSAILIKGKYTVQVEIMASNNEGTGTLFREKVIYINESDSPGDLDLNSFVTPLTPISVTDKPRIKAQLENLDQCNTAKGNTATISVSTNFGNLLEYDIGFDDVPPGEGLQEVDFGALNVQWPENVEDATIHIEVHSENGDTDQSNNIITQTFIVEDTRIDKETAVQKGIEYLFEIGVDTTFAIGRIYPGYLYSEDELRWNYNVLNPDMVIFEDSWIMQIDPSPLSRFEKPVGILILNAITCEISYHEVFWELTINANLYPEITNTEDIVFGGQNNKTTTVDASEETLISSPIQKANDSENVCFIGITGTTNSAYQANGFYADLLFLSQDLQKENNGPQLKDNQIIKLANPTVKEAQSVIDSLNGQYDKLYFVYSGHGSKGENAGMLLKDGTYEYSQFWEDIFKEDIGNHCILIDACYSGLIIDAYRENIDGITKETTIVASSEADLTSAFTRATVTHEGQVFLAGMGAFTFPFLDCLGADAADKDENNFTTYREAFDWVKSEGITDKLKKQKPVIFEWSYKRWSDQFLEPKPGVKLTKKEGLEDADISVGEEVNGNGVSGNISDEVFSLSEGRLFDIEAYGNDESFLIDLELEISELWDELEGPGDFGIVTRETPEDIFVPHYPTIYNDKRNTLTAIDVDHFSQWALANVEKSLSTTERPDIGVTVFPNPVFDFFQLEVDLQSQQSVRIDLLGIGGQAIRSLYNGLLFAGTNTLKFDRNTIPNGMYLLSIEQEGHNEMVKIVLE